MLSGSAVLPQAQPTDIYLTELGIVLTSVYLWGLITRPHRQVLRMGLDSLTVLVLYAAGIAGLIAVTNLNAQVDVRDPRAGAPTRKASRFGLGGAAPAPNISSRRGGSDAMWRSPGRVGGLAAP